MLRVRFAPSPTGFLHVGSARTFIFNWLFARRNGGTMIFRLDDTDVGRNTEASVNSIFDGLRWLGLNWDEEYKQSERLELHRRMAQVIFDKGLAYRDFTPAKGDVAEGTGPAGEGTGATDGGTSAGGGWLFNPDMRELSLEESDRRAAAGEPFALRFRVPRDTERQVKFVDAVYGEQSRSTNDIEDFALLRSDGMPTYHLGSCADDADLRISHIIRGQDHLSNTFKHVLIFEAMGAEVPQFAHLPLLVAPDGTKLSKRRHGPVVSVTTYRDAGFLPEAFINFLCLLGWSPKNDREKMSLEELTAAFSLEGINRANAVVNFEDVPSAVVAPVPSPEGPAVAAPNTFVAPPSPAAGPVLTSSAPSAVQSYPEETFDPKAVWLNAEHIRALPVEETSARLLAVVREAGYDVTQEKMLAITPLVRERIKLLRDVLSVADFFFTDELAPYDPADLVPQKGDQKMAVEILKKSRELLAQNGFDRQSLEQTLRTAAQEMGVKAGQMFTPIRVAVTGKKNAPPLFETLEVLGREKTLERIDGAIEIIS